MCGGLMISVARNPKTLALYHLGRLMGYSVLGALAGFLGQQVFQSLSISYLPEITTALLALSFIYMGVRVWKGQSIHLFQLPPSLLKKLHRLGGHGPFAVGVLSAVLPCGWLHVFVLGAVSLQNPLQGGLYLFLFWLGTLPALSAASFAASRALRPLSQVTPKLSGILLISLGIFSLGLKVLPLSGQQHCHTPSAETSHSPVSGHAHHHHSHH